MKTSCACSLQCQLLARAVAWLLALGSRGVGFASGPGEDRTDYRFEYYAEEEGRTLVRTHTASVQAALNETISARSEFVHDAISGATPIGGPPAVPGGDVPVAELRDERWAGNLELALSVGRHTIKPLFAYSLENDYESRSPALNWEIDFNRRNTTLLLGVAGNFDSIFAPTLRGRTEVRESGDFLVGISQVLSPSTLVSLNFTLGTASGYLSDPYKRVRFELAPEGVLELERRPRHRTRQIVDATLRQHVTPFHGSAELGYRFYHDSFGIVSQTVGLSWFQTLTRWWTLSPMVRYYVQSDADFFAPQFAGDPSNPYLAEEFPVPDFYSADYRLSRMHTWTYGIGSRFQLGRRWTLDLAYKRYEMTGDDGRVASGNFPRAHVYTVGFGATF